MNVYLKNLENRLLDLTKSSGADVRQTTGAFAHAKKPIFQVR